MSEDVAVDAYATVDDLKARWPDFPAGADAHAEVLLLDASQFILDECPSAVEASALTLKRITCAVVKRAMAADNMDMAGLETWQATAGPMSMSGKPSNPHGDLYLTRAEKRALGCGKQRAFSVDLLAGNDVP